MRLMNYLRFNKKTARLAKDRLHIIIAQERGEQQNSPDYLPLLRQDILNVIAKYTKADIDQVKVEFHRQDNNSILELNVTLPETTTVD